MVFEKGFTMRFIGTIILIYFIWQFLKIVFGWALRYWIRKNGGRFFYYSNFPGGSERPDQRSEGEIRIDNVGGRPQQTKKPSEEGDYVDYEEVK